jgi:invasion protein IalB
MPRRPFFAISMWLALGVATAQGTGSWQVESEFDLYSYLGLGSMWVAAYQAPADLEPGDAPLVIGCAPGAPSGFEIAAWAAPTGTYALAAERLDVDVLLRFDQGPVLNQTWFLVEGPFATEVVAPFELDQPLFAGLATADNLALRIQADPASGVEERTLQYAVGGFSQALAELRCGTPEPPAGPADDPFGDAAPATDPFGDGPDPAVGGTPDPDPFADGGADATPEALVIGAWVFDGADGMVASGDLGVLAVYCAADVANGVEIEVGDYALSDAAYAVVFRSGSIDFLKTTATRNQFDAAQLDGDDVEDRLVRFLRGVVDVTVTLTPRSGEGPPMTYRVPTDGFNDALAALGCYLGDR